MTTPNVDIPTIIKAARLAMPGMRVGQLISSALGLDPEWERDLFYITDEELASKLRAFVSHQLVQKIQL